MNYICQECGGILQDLAALLIHMNKTHDQIPKLQCILCNEKYSGFDVFDKHLQYAHGTNHWGLNLALKQTNRYIKKYDNPSLNWENLFEFKIDFVPKS